MRIEGNVMINIINTILNFVISAFLGYCLNAIKNYKKSLQSKKENENIQNLALLTLLQNALTNTFFVYNEKKEIPDYVYKNWLNLKEIYSKLGGNDYIHTLEKKMESWKIVKTDIL